MTELSTRIAEVRARIRAACERCGRDAASVELLPVSKRQPLERIREAVHLGFTRFGENYVQEGSAKATALPEATFVLIGPLQRNKAKPALQHFGELMTLDRPELANRLRPLAEELGVVRPVWIQIDLWDEETKLGGCRAEDLAELLAALGDDPRLPLQGFMAIPPPDLPEAFREVDRLRKDWQQVLGRALRVSMGMSDDLEEAIAAGADQVRIGTDLFGSRSNHP